MTTIAVVQFKADTEKQRNLKKILEFIHKAAKRNAQLCTFPEFMMFYTSSSQSARDLASLAETTDGEFVSTIADCAKENSIQVVGTFYEKSKKIDKVFDTSFLVNEKGKILSKYRKIHLYDALGFKESKKLVSGSKIVRPA